MSERMRGRLTKPHEVTVVLVGDANVGKTALVTRFCEDIFIEVRINQLLRPTYILFTFKK
jgi:GTPase SAR1 family protein